MHPLDKANQLIEQGDLEKALVTLRRLLAKARQEDDEIMLPIVLANLGQLYLDLKRPKEALKALEEGLSIAREEGYGPDELEAALLNNLGNVHHALGNKETAHEHYEQALAMARELKDTKVESQILFNLGSYYTDVGRPLDALAAFERYLSILPTQTNLPEKLEALDIVTHLYRETGQSEKEFESLQQIFSIAQKTKDRFREGVVLLNLGIYCQNRLRLQEAVEYYHQALVTSRQPPNPALEGSSLSHLGHAYLELDMDEEALNHYEQALQILDQAGGARYLEADIHNGMAHLYARSDDWERQMNHLQKSLTLAREARDGRLEREALLSLAHLYEGVGNMREALQRCSEVLAIDREHQNQLRMGDALCYMGELLRRIGETELAINQCEWALKLAREIHHQGGIANALRGLARAYCDKGRFDQAAPHFEEAIEIYETSRRNMLSPDWRTARSSIGHEVYLDYIRLLVEQKELARALFFAERRKARVFLDLLVETRAEVYQGVDPAARDKQEALARELRDLHEQLTAQLTMPEAKRDVALVVSLEARQREAELAYQINEAEIRRHNPRYASLVAPDVWEVKRLQEVLLDEQTVLLEYVLDEPKSWLFVVSKNKLEVFPLPSKEEIETQVDELYAAVKDKGEFISVASDLYEQLLKPAEELILDKRLLIVPDEKLHFIPFATLLTAPIKLQQSIRFADLPYLIRRNAIAYAPSASVAGFLESDRRQRSHTWLHELIAFAFAESFIVPKREVTRDGPSSLEAALAHIRSSGVFSPLPGTRKEVVRIASLLDDDVAHSLTRSVNLYDGKSVKIRLGPEATKSALLSFFGPRAEPQPTRFVHFATHGVVDSVKPQFSGLIFNPGKESNPYWQTFEIFNARIPSDLVVLSACETGLGKVFNGEGLIGLARAFFYAGAATVCPTLWAVDDESTSDLMQRFYGYLLKHRNDNSSS
ncbi:MAG TPA: tetratricopeptide repeat protein, partial [Pyrinomonadaceae bacterium]|nr:tetratricopeptide repeat protein [Pyrinomonadaceae bacterium]